MGKFNQVVAERDLAGVTDRRLVDRIRAGEPITHDDGVPWTGLDFFAAYTGELQPPKTFTQPEETVTQEDVDYWARELQALFRDTVMDLMMPAPDVWQLIEDKSVNEKGMALEDLIWLKEVVVGLSQPTLEEILRQCIKYPVDQFESACVEVCRSEKVKQKAIDLKDFVMRKKGTMPRLSPEYPAAAEIAVDHTYSLRERMGMIPKGSCHTHAYGLMFIKPTTPAHGRDHP